MTNPFDARARTWDEDAQRLQRAADIFSALERHIPLRRELAVLDYGAGTGLLALALAPRVRRLTAVDSSRGMLDVLAQKAKAAGIGNLVLLQSDFTADPPPVEPYDLIVSAMTLHHVVHVENLLRIFFHLLCSNGFLALADLDAEDGSFHSEPAGVHHFGFDRTALARQLEASGFTNIRFDTPTQIEKRGLTYPVFLVVAHKP